MNNYFKFGHTLITLAGIKTVTAHLKFTTDYHGFSLPSEILLVIDYGLEKPIEKTHKINDYPDAARNYILNLFSTHISYQYVDEMDPWPPQARYYDNQYGGRSYHQSKKMVVKPIYYGFGTVSIDKIIQFYTSMLVKRMAKLEKKIMNLAYPVINPESIDLNHFFKTTWPKDNIIEEVLKH